MAAQGLNPVFGSSGSGLLNFVLAESALELVPEEIWRQPAVVSDSRRRGKEAGSILLDRSFHHSAMTRLKDSEKRGRPDLVHVALLSVTGTPLYLDGKMKLFVHTCGGKVLEVEEKTRIPKHYVRFRGLMEEALGGETQGGLVRVREIGVKELVRRARADRVFGLSVLGKQGTAEELAERAGAAKNPAVVVGGFPHGHFSKDTAAVLDELVRVDPRPLEAHVVASRVVYEVEKAKTRFND
jgi:rRNA small subunit pseudouridine methyltransferase Nep1